MWAAYKGRTPVAQMLLDKGANPNITGQVLDLTPTFRTCINRLEKCLLDGKWTNDVYS